MIQGKSLLVRGLNALAVAISTPAGALVIVCYPGNRPVSGQDKARTTAPGTKGRINQPTRMPRKPHPEEMEQRGLTRAQNVSICVVCAGSRKISQTEQIGGSGRDRSAFLRCGSAIAR